MEGARGRAPAEILYADAATRPCIDAMPDNLPRPVLREYLASHAPACTFLRTGTSGSIDRGESHDCSTHCRNVVLSSADDGGGPGGGSRSRGPELQDAGGPEVDRERDVSRSEE